MISTSRHALSSLLRGRHLPKLQTRPGSRNASTETNIEVSAVPPHTESGQEQRLVQELQRRQQMIEAQARRAQQSRSGDKLLYLTALGLILFTPPVVYYWWCHRAEHMAKKKEDMIRALQERRKKFVEEKK